MAAMSLEATLEYTPLAPRTVKSEVAKHVDWTPGQWSGEDTEDSQEDEGDREEAESLIATDNEAMASLSEKKQRLANYHGLGHEVSSNAISRKTERLVW